MIPVSHGTCARPEDTTDLVNIVTSCRARRVRARLTDVSLSPKSKKATKKTIKVAAKENRTKDFGRPNYTDGSKKSFTYESRKHKGTLLGHVQFW